MAKFYPGQIVRRHPVGWTPLRVISTTEHGFWALYCGGISIDPQFYTNEELVLVQDPVLEFDRCNNWEARLNSDDKLWLQRQLHATAKPLPWLTEETTSKGNPMSKLYQTKEPTPRFGILLATNSAGKFVLEMKGTGEVLTFDKKEVEEVKPYTVRIRFQDSATDYEYLSRKGDVEKGDMIILADNGHIAKVVAVDTKSDKATRDLVGRKVVTAPFGGDVTE